MKPLFLASLLTLAAAPALAEEPAPPAGGFSLMEEGAKLLLRGLMTEAEPALDEMARALRDLGPSLNTLLGLVDDIGNYHAPELLENGDIILRRKTPLPALPPAPQTEL